MLKKLVWLFAGIPVAILLIVLSVANRQTVTLRLDPFNTENPALAVTLPFFLYLFIAALAGILLGGIFSWLSQRPYRRAAKSEHARARKLENEVAAQKKRAEDMAMQAAASDSGQSRGFPLLGHSRDAGNRKRSGGDWAA